MPVFGPTIVTPLMTADNPWTFKMGANPDGVGKRLCSIVKGLNLKRIAMVFTRDNTGQVAYKETAVACMPGTGATVTTVQSATDATDDYSSFITNIKNSNPDGIFTLLSGERSAQFEVQARQAGIPTSIRFYGPNTVTGANFINIGKQSVEGTVGVTEYFPGTENDTNKRFVAAYQAKYNALPDNYAAQGYALMSALVEGLKKSGSKITRESLATEVAKLTNQPTVMGLGKLSFQDHNPIFDLVVVQVQGGKLVLFKEVA
jgi:branched-chain amino acid transport system substrate-binding protein